MCRLRLTAAEGGVNWQIVTSGQRSMEKMLETNRFGVLGGSLEIWAYAYLRACVYWIEAPSSSNKPHVESHMFLGFSTANSTHAHPNIYPTRAIL